MTNKAIAGLTGVALVLSLGLAGCGTSTTPDTSGAATAQEQKAPLDLTGEWKQSNSDSDSAWMSATISEDTIEVYWVSDNGDTKTLYFAGSYVPPTTSDDSYTWDSANDTSKTSKSMLATSADTKTFSYADGELTVDVSALGTTKTVRFERQ